MSLQVKNVAAGYGSLEILHDVSINASTSQTVALIGPNGAGKSTLLKSIFGYIKPSHGRVFFDGEDITGLRPEQILRKGLSYVPQGRTVFPYLTVLENLKLGAYILNDRELIRANMAKVLEIFPVLKERLNQMAGNLSGGEQRMLELGRTLMLRPKLILLDEPSLGLAPLIIKEVYKILKLMREEGLGLLVVEQNVRQVLKVADYVYVLDLGRNRFKGAPKEFLDNPKLINLYLGGAADVS